MNHIFPKDWVDVHPYKQTDDVDRYFAKLADKVYVTILQSPLYDISLGDPKDLSIYLTLWFEDIISGTNIWRTVNRECMRRIGAPLPFYDIDKYYEGEPNVEDIRVLLWYYLELTNDNSRLFNPENPGLMQLADVLCPIFDEAYSDAPENERLREFLLQPNLTDDYWNAHKVMTWFGSYSYIMIDPINRVYEQVTNTYDDDSPIDIQQSMYAELSQYVFRGRKNLLSFTTAEWLCAMRSDLGEDEKLANMVQSYPQLFDVLSTDSQTIQVKNVLTNQQISISRDSWTPDDSYQRKVKEGMQILCNIIPWGDVYYQSGVLTLNDKLPKDKLMHILHPDQSFLAPRWEKVAKGEPAIFYRNEKERERIYSQLDLKNNLDTANPIPKDFACGAIGFSAENGLCIIQNVAALKTDKNPFYNQSYAQTHAIEFICSPHSVTYDIACHLLRAGWLADATMNSINGPEYGHAYLQKHAQFLLDYFHEQHR